MPLSLSWTLFLLPGLCCLLPSSQAEDAREADACDHGKFQEPSRCQRVALTIANLSFSLLREAPHWSRHTNILFSPMSITAALAMLSLGTKGDTRKQITERLKLNLIDMAEADIHKCFCHLLRALHQPDHRPQLTIGSCLFIDENLKPVDRFLKEVKRRYHSDTISINFRDKEAKKQINDHVAEKTHGKILESVSVLEKGTALALVDYISFHAHQNDEFQVEHMVNNEFHVHKKKVVVVDMVSRLGRFYLHRDTSLSSWVLVRHYVGDAMAFFILPGLGKIQQLEKSLNPEHLDNIQKRITLRFANIYFPKLSISGIYDLKTILRTVGITQVFSNRADLSGVTEDAPLKLSKAVHKAVLGIEEEGTNSPEITDVSDDISWPQAITVMFNRPFLIIIRDEFINVPFLIGRVENPK